MPLEYSVDGSRRLAITRGRGVITEAEARALVDTLAADPSIATAVGHLVDLREVTEVAAGTEAIRDLSRTAVFAPGARRAYLVSSDLLFGVSRMVASYAALAGHNVEVFRDMDEALSWIGVPNPAP